MATPLYNRKLRVTITKLSGSFAGSYEIEDLRISFDITKNSEKNANTAKIQIYNMSEDSWSRFESEKDRYIILEAGYEDALETLFTGTMTTATRRREGTETIVEFEAGDGQKALKTAKIDKTYKKGTSFKQAIKDTAKKLFDAGGVILGEITDQITGKSNQSFSLSGLAADVMERLLGKQGLEFSIQNNKLIIKPKDSTTQDQAVVLSAKTGLVGKPIKKDIGVEFNCLIVPGLFPGRKVKIESEEFDEFFQVRTAKFVGDNYGNSWQATIEATRVKQ